MDGANSPAAKRVLRSGVGASTRRAQTALATVLYLNPHGERAGAERMLDTLLRGHLRRAPLRYQPRLVCGSEGAFSEGLRSDGVPVDIQRLRLRELAGSVAWLRAYLLRHGVRLVHTTMSHFHQFAWLACRGLGIPCLWFNHGPCRSGWWKGLLHVTPADATVVMNRFMEAQHRGLTLAPPPRTIAYGLEPHWFEARPGMRAAARAAWGVADHELAVGILGRIDAWKRQHLFLEAVSHLPAELAAQARFYIGGAPALGRGREYFEELQRRQAAHRYRDRIALLGYVEAEPFWEAMDVAVHCTDTEPFGYVILEAMAKGKVVIAARSGGVLDILTHGHDGFLEEPTQVAGLAARLAHVLARYETLAPLRAEARTTAMSRYHGDRLVSEFEALYDELLEARGLQAPVG